MRKKLWTVLALATSGVMGCFGGEGSHGEPDYGVPVEDGDGDGDGDGWYDYDDCDDGDASVHPEADEICDDGVDNDCDDAVDADDVDCEANDRPLWKQLSKGAAAALRIAIGEHEETGSVMDYSGWATDQDLDDWDEDPDDVDGTVTEEPGATARP